MLVIPVIPVDSQPCPQPLFPALYTRNTPTTSVEQFVNCLVFGIKMHLFIWHWIECSPCLLSISTPAWTVDLFQALHKVMCGNGESEKLLILHRHVFIFLAHFFKALELCCLYLNAPLVKMTERVGIPIGQALICVLCCNPSFPPPPPL